MTNYERIKNMSVEEMAKTIVDNPSIYLGDMYCTDSCKSVFCPHEVECCIQWLESEVDG